MCRAVTRTLQPERVAAGFGREFVDEALRRWEVLDPRDATCPCRGSDLRNPVVLPYGRRVEHVGGPWDH